MKVIQWGVDVNGVWTLDEWTAGCMCEVCDNLDERIDNGWGPSGAADSPTEVQRRLDYIASR